MYSCWLLDKNETNINFCYRLQGFPYWGMGGFPLHQIFIPSPPRVNTSYSHCSSTIFVLISYSFDKQVMLSLILTGLHYSQKSMSLLLNVWEDLVYMKVIKKDPHLLSKDVLFLPTVWGKNKTHTWGKNGTLFSIIMIHIGTIKKW